MVVGLRRGSALAAFLGLGLLVTALVGFSRAEVGKDPFDTMGVDRPAAPLAAPDVSFRTLEGRDARLGDLRGKVVLLGFFTSA